MSLSRAFEIQPAIRKYAGSEASISIIEQFVRHLEARYYSIIMYHLSAYHKRVDWHMENHRYCLQDLAFKEQQYGSSFCAETSIEIASNKCFHNHILTKRPERPFHRLLAIYLSLKW